VEVANKGGVRGEGAVGRLLTMAQEMGDGPVRHSGARWTVALSRLDRGRGLHVSEREEGKAVWAGRSSLGQLVGGPALGRGELGHDWAENRRWAKVQKEILFEFQLIFLEFGRTLENCKRRFRWNFDMVILSKIF
jgi:hypothetical protein